MLGKALQLCGYEVLQVLTGHDLHGSHDLCEKVLRIKGDVKEWSQGNTGSSFFINLQASETEMDNIS